VCGQAAGLQPADCARALIVPAQYQARGRSAQQLLCLLHPAASRLVPDLSLVSELDAGGLAVLVFIIGYGLRQLIFDHRRP
jgi:hypothetical protein